MKAERIAYVWMVFVGLSGYITNYQPRLFLVFIISSFVIWYIFKWLFEYRLVDKRNVIVYFGVLGMLGCFFRLLFIQQNFDGAILSLSSVIFYMYLRKLRQDAEKIALEEARARSSNRRGPRAR